MSSELTLAQLKDRTIVSCFSFVAILFLKLYKYVDGKVVYAEPYGSMIFENSNLAHHAIVKMKEVNKLEYVDQGTRYVVAPFDYRRDHSLSIPTICFRLMNIGGSEQIHKLHSPAEWAKWAERLQELEEYRYIELEGRYVVLDPIGQYVTDHGNEGTAIRLVRRFNELRDRDMKRALS